MNTLHSSIRSSINYYTILNESFFLSLQSRFFFDNFKTIVVDLSINQSINDDDYDDDDDVRDKNETFLFWKFSRNQQIRNSFS